MNKILLLVPALLLLIAYFCEIIISNIYINSIFSVFFLYVIYFIFFIKHKQTQQNIILSSIYYLAYDIIFYNIIGTSLLSFTTVSIVFFLILKKEYKQETSIIQYLILGNIFFALNCILNCFVLSEKLNVSLLLCQLSIFNITTLLVFFFFGTNDDKHVYKLNI